MARCPVSWMPKLVSIVVLEDIIPSHLTINAVVAVGNPGIGSALVAVLSLRDTTVSPFVNYYGQLTSLDLGSTWSYKGVRPLPGSAYYNYINADNPTYQYNGEMISINYWQDNVNGHPTYFRVPSSGALGTLYESKHVAADYANGVNGRRDIPKITSLNNSLLPVVGSYLTFIDTKRMRPDGGTYWKIGFSQTQNGIASTWNKFGDALVCGIDFYANPTTQAGGSLGRFIMVCDEWGGSALRIGKRLITLG